MNERFGIREMASVPDLAMAEIKEPVFCLDTEKGGGSTSGRISHMLQGVASVKEFRRL